MKALLTKKIGMTSVISEDGGVAAVTLLSADSNVVTQIKSNENDGYQAVQVGAFEAKKVNKPQINHLKSAKKLVATMREIRMREVPENTKIGDQMSADLFGIGDEVNVTATSKGKGFAGTIKRHNFKLGRKTHGGSSYRRPGSIGSMYPQKIFKGKRMAGQMGNEQVTTKNLKIAIVDKDNSVIGVFGSVPGPRKGLVLIRGVET